MLGELTELLEAARTPFAAIDLDNLSRCYPSPAGDDRFRSVLTFKNLASAWQNLAAAGARRLVIARVVETRAELEHYQRAVPGAEITVVRLRAAGSALQDRIARREIGLGREWHSQRAQELAELMDRERVENLLIETDDRTVNEIAREILTRTGWLSE